jgi:Asp-tRNA(Asn)/Glu-tRNA(Gln) amidotransferase A subunit family amidase
MSKSRAGSYDPRTFKALTFHDATARFRDGADSPRAYLERCLEAIAEREPDVKAFAALNEATARAAADASAARWKAGRQLSVIDGMPVGIKDLLETKEMPTGLGCAAYRDNFPKRDNAAVWALRRVGAVILGKTVTAELGGAEPGPTRNPRSTRRARPAVPLQGRQPRSAPACCRRPSARRWEAPSSARQAIAATLR